MVMASACAWATGNQTTLVSDSESEPIHSAVVRNEAWTVDPVRRLRLDAERRIKEGPWSVTFDRPQGLLDLDPHEYYSQAPYWWPQDDPKAPYVRKDGQINPNRFLANKNSLNSMSDAVFTLGTAAYLLGDVKYARRAARVLRVWFVDPATRMNPSLEYAQAVRNMNSGRGMGIIDGRVFIRAIQGMEFLAETGQWDAKDQAAVRKWFQEYLHWLTTSEHGLDEKNSPNTHAAWWSAQVAAVATFVGDEAAQKMVFAWYREQVMGRPLLYSAFNLEAMSTLCRIAQVNGVDLWSAKAKNGATLATLADYLIPSLSDPKKWTKEQIADFTSEGLYYLAFAGMGLKRSEYIALYRKIDHGENAWTGLVDLLASRWENASHQTRH